MIINDIAFNPTLVKALTPTSPLAQQAAQTGGSTHETPSVAAMRGAGAAPHPAAAPHPTGPGVPGQPRAGHKYVTKFWNNEKGKWDYCYPDEEGKSGCGPRGVSARSTGMGVQEVPHRFTQHGEPVPDPHTMEFNLAHGMQNPEHDYMNAVNQALSSPGAVMDVYHPRFENGLKVQLRVNKKDRSQHLALLDHEGKPVMSSQVPDVPGKGRPSKGPKPITFNNIGEYRRWFLATANAKTVRDHTGRDLYHIVPSVGDVDKHDPNGGYGQDSFIPFKDPDTEKTRPHAFRIMPDPTHPYASRLTEHRAQTLNDAYRTVAENQRKILLHAAGHKDTPPEAAAAMQGMIQKVNAWLEKPAPGKNVKAVEAEKVSPGIPPRGVPWADPEKPFELGEAHKPYGTPAFEGGVEAPPKEKKSEKVPSEVAPASEEPPASEVASASEEPPEDLIEHHEAPGSVYDLAQNGTLKWRTSQDGLDRELDVDPETKNQYINEIADRHWDQIKKQAGRAVHTVRSVDPSIDENAARAYVAYAAGGGTDLSQGKATIKPGSALHTAIGHLLNRFENAGGVSLADHINKNKASFGSRIVDALHRDGVIPRPSSTPKALSLDAPAGESGATLGQFVGGSEEAAKPEHALHSWFGNPESKNPVDRVGAAEGMLHALVASAPDAATREAARALAEGSLAHLNSLRQDPSKTDNEKIEEAQRILAPIVRNYPHHTEAASRLRQARDEESERDLMTRLSSPSRVQAAPTPPTPAPEQAPAPAPEQAPAPTPEPTPSVPPEETLEHWYGDPKSKDPVAKMGYLPGLLRTLAASSRPEHQKYVDEDTQDLEGMLGHVLRHSQINPQEKLDFARRTHAAMQELFPHFQQAQDLYHQVRSTPSDKSIKARIKELMASRAQKSLAAGEDLRIPFAQLVVFMKALSVLKRDKNVPPEHEYAFREGEEDHPRHYFKDPKGNVLRYTNAPTGNSDRIQHAGDPRLHFTEPTFEKNPTYFTPDGRKLTRCPECEAEQVEWNSKYNRYDPSNLWAARWRDQKTGVYRYSYIHSDIRNVPKLHIYQQNTLTDVRLPQLRDYYTGLYNNSDKIKDQMTGIMLALLDQGRCRAIELSSLSGSDLTIEGSLITLGNRKIYADSRLVTSFLILKRMIPETMPLFSTPKQKKADDFDGTVHRRMGPHYLSRVLDMQGMSLLGVQTYHATMTYSREVDRMLRQFQTGWDQADQYASLVVALEWGHDFSVEEDPLRVLQLVKELLVDPIAVSVLRSNAEKQGLLDAPSMGEPPQPSIQVPYVSMDLTARTPEEKEFSGWIHSVPAHQYADIPMEKSLEAFLNVVAA